MKQRKGIFTITHGCQMNQYDSVRMKQALADEYDDVSNEQEADVIIVNTCSVREKPQAKVLSELGRLKPLKDKNPNLILVVAGCVAQQEKGTLLDKVPYLDLVVGPDAEAQLPQLIKEIQNQKRMSETGFNHGDFSLDDLPPLANFGKEGAVSAFVAVQKGCNHFCTYCIVPHLRGREKSRPLSEIVHETKRLADVGIKEVTLLGQNVNGYGADFNNKPDFVDLLEAVSQIDGIERVRFVTSHPASLTDRQIDAFASIPEVCEYLHLPIQAGSDRILELMKRGYTQSVYLDAIDRLKSRIPDLALSGDVIVGFPGETEADFRETLDVMNKVHFDTLFSFIYSARPGTPAAKLEDPIPYDTKQQWLSELVELQREHSRESNNRMVGTDQIVLIEGVSKRDEAELTGRTRTNKIVNFPADKSMLGKFATVKITRAFQNSLRGEII